jgi:non-ribosomal peptide synthetase component F
MSIGCIYVPLNPADPVERLAYLINDINAPIILTQTHLADKVNSAINIAANNSGSVNVGETTDQIKNSADNNTKAITLDNFNYNTILSEQTNNNLLPLVKIESNSIAYVIYTSGSTGKPKGAQLTHLNFLNVVASYLWSGELISSSGIMLATARCTFDVHVVESIAELLLSGSVILLKPDGNLDLDYYSNTILANLVTHVVNVPSFALTLAEFILSNLDQYKGRFSSLLSYRLNGEGFPVSTARLLDSILPQRCRIVNCYGPAECTDNCTIYCINRKKDLFNDKNYHLIPLGGALLNYQLFVLNSTQELVSPVLGAIGELYIGGPGVYHSYLNNEELTTKAKLQLNHIHPNGPLYKSGDLVQFIHGNLLMFIGRVDYQVKLRGQRLEVGEIENTIIQSNPTLIKQCIVIKLVGDNNNEFLAAYCVINSSSPSSSGIIADNSSNNSASSAALQLRSSIYNYCQSKLQSYMLPSAIILLGENKMKQVNIESHIFTD